MSATTFLTLVKNVDRFKRDEVATNVILEGHVPGKMRDFTSVCFTAKDGEENVHVVTFRALVDYLCIGTDDDYVRVPLNPLSAQRIADVTTTTLPTTKIVDIVWGAASNKLDPLPWGPPYDASMMSTARIPVHNARINAELKSTYCDPTQLTAGHKKDVVVSNALETHSKSVAIYGWHKKNGEPIQPLYVGHENLYCDYSHGIRLIDRECIIDSQSHDILAVLSDPMLSVLLSSEGQLRVLRQPNA
jgi:hypothetical protein